MKLSNVLNRRNRILLRELVITDFKLRYQNSVLGYLWSILKPLLLFAILYVVFDKFLALGRDIEHFPVYLLVGIVLWQFFNEATVNGLQSIVARGDLIRKINFPKYIIILSSTVSALINLAINMIIVVLFCLINGVELHVSALWTLPLIVGLYVFSLGVAFFLAALNVKYRDVGYLWEIFLQGAFYATPILYPIQMVINQMPQAANWLMINPVAQIIQDIRYVLVTKQTTTIWLLISDWRAFIPLGVVIVTVMAGAWYFKKNSKSFAEEI